ncbi:MAG: hypothetical protein AAFO95_05440 [Cyanobacteria bacterium J06600_6]
MSQTNKAKFSGYVSRAAKAVRLAMEKRPVTYGINTYDVWHYERTEEMEIIIRSYFTNTSIEIAVASALLDVDASF